MRAELVDSMGDDHAVVNAARVSMDKESFEFVKEDERLIHYLAKHNHWTPFAHTAIKLRMQAPVPIRTQCFKHKSGFVENEESRRYISSDPEFFMPDVFRKAPTGSIKQGSGEPMEDQDLWRSEFEIVYENCLVRYQLAIEEGMCPEQARFLLPQGCEVNWIWTGNVASFARFCKQRTDVHAQKEIRDLAQEVSNIIQPLFPVSWSALTETS